MTSEQSLLSEVAAHPDDDAPRLVYADWLEARGDARREFIRLQRELVRMDEDDERRHLLQEREAALHAEHGAAWVRPMRKYVGRVEFRRGFPEQVTLPAKKFLEHAEKIFE